MCAQVQAAKKTCDTLSFQIEKSDKKTQKSGTLQLKHLEWRKKYASALWMFQWHKQQRNTRFTHRLMWARNARCTIVHGTFKFSIFIWDIFFLFRHHKFEAIILTCTKFANTLNHLRKTSNRFFSHIYIAFGIYIFETDNVFWVHMKIQKNHYLWYRKPTHP